MSEDMTKEEAIDFFAELFGGEHHIPGKGARGEYPSWYIIYDGDLATYDGDRLTRLVLLAHDRCFRANVSNGGPGRLKISIWKRKQREGGNYWDCHPEIETALATWREMHPREESK